MIYVDVSILGKILSLTVAHSCRSCFCLPFNTEEIREIYHRHLNTPTFKIRKEERKILNLEEGIDSSYLYLVKDTYFHCKTNVLEKVFPYLVQTITYASQG